MTHLLLTLSFLCLLASPALAFPDNGVLDDFAGCTDDASPPNANWTNATIEAGDTLGLDCEDLAATSGGTSAGNRSGGYYDIAAFNANQEAYLEVVNTANTATIDVCGRLVNIGDGTTDGYCVRQNETTIEIFRIDNGIFTSLATAISQATDVNDTIGIRMEGDQICSWFNNDGAGWVELDCVTDGTYTAGGHIGLTVDGSHTVGAADNFGGGDLAVAAILQQGGGVPAALGF